jgi:hypothetical protein
MVDAVGAPSLDEVDKLVRQSRTCTLWMAVALFTPATSFQGAVVAAWSSGGCLPVVAGGLAV